MCVAGDLIRARAGLFHQFGLKVDECDHTFDVVRLRLAQFGNNQVGRFILLASVHQVGEFVEIPDEESAHFLGLRKDLSSCVGGNRLVELVETLTN